jgi:type 1 glutamine amidotransferase
MSAKEQIMILKGVYGDYYHAAALYVHALKKAAEGMDAKLEGWYYPTTFDPGMLQHCDLLVLCKEGVLPGAEINTRWMDREGEDAVERFVASGGTLFAWHSGLASYDPEGPLHAMFGGRFRGHPPQHEFGLRPTDVSSPFYPSGEPFSISDELYRYTVEPSNAAIWLQGHSPEHGVHPVGWTRKHGEGTVVALTIAHNRSVLLDPRVQEMLKNIIASA